MVAAATALRLVTKTTSGSLLHGGQKGAPPRPKTRRSPLLLVPFNGPVLLQIVPPASGGPRHHVVQIKYKEFPTFFFFNTATAKESNLAGKRRDLTYLYER